MAKVVKLRNGAELYTGDCDHKASRDKKHQHIYGTAYCPDCGASRGIDGRWRVLK